MDIKKIDNTLSVSAQIRAEDIPALKDQAFAGLSAIGPMAKAPTNPPSKPWKRPPQPQGWRYGMCPLSTGRFGMKI